MKRKIISVTLILCLILSSAPIQAAGASVFNDLDQSHWAYGSITQVVEAGLFAGTSSTAFSPDTTMTRAMYVAVLMRLYGGSAAGRAPFSDVPAGSWYEEAVIWAYENGVAAGTSSSAFSPDAAVNREQASVLLARSLGKDQNGGMLHFTDAGSISGWAVSAIGNMQSDGILTGYSDGTFRPQASLTRAEAAVLFAGVLDLLDEEDISYTVSFETGSGSQIAAQSVKSGEKASAPADPTRSGYSFNGWYEEEALTNRYDFDTPVENDLILYARWDAVGASSVGGSRGGGGGGGGGSTPEPAKTYTVSFNSNGGSTVASQSVSEGKTATEPAAPTRGDYYFLGWYSDSSLARRFDFSTAITSDITLCAKWTQETPGSERNPFTVNNADEMAKVGRGGEFPGTVYAEWTLDKHYRLAKDITLTDWIPIGYSSQGIYPGGLNGLKGSFDGEGHRITVRSVTSGDLLWSDGETVEFIGIFARLEPGGIIKNLTVDGSITRNSSGSKWMGGIVGDNAGKIENCSVNAEIKGSGGKNIYIGGIAGIATNNIFTGVGSFVKDIDFTGTVSASGIDENIFAGGIIGRASLRGSVENVSVTAATISASGAPNNYAGGIVGDNYGNIRNAHSDADVMVTGNADNCTGYAGGIAGDHTVIDDVGRISGSSSTGSVAVAVSGSNALAYAGGIAGRNGGEMGSNRNEPKSIIENSYSSSRVTAEGNDAYAGGITGKSGAADFEDSVKIENCYWTGSEVSASGESAFTGGIAGVNDALIENAYALGAVTASGSTTAYAGGISSFNNGTFGIINNCAALGSSITAVNGTDRKTGRIAAAGDGLYNNCWAIAISGLDMEGSQDNNQGGLITEGGEIEQSFYENILGWSFAGKTGETGIWKWNGTLNRPVLN